MVHNLEPLQGQQKSFYGKALVIVNDAMTSLQSYATTVADYNVITKELNVYGTYSNTTIRHLRAFINQYTPYEVRGSKDMAKFIKGGN